MFTAAPAATVCEVPGLPANAGLPDAAAVGDVLAAAFTDTPIGALLTINRTARRRVPRWMWTALAAAAAANDGAVHLRSDGAGFASPVAARLAQAGDLPAAAAG